jgi:asparagine synthase (glutamine-hydrolysing)
MCGFTGFLTPNQTLNASQAESTLIKMSNALSHRGPDHQGIWIDSQRGIALGHRRLSIIDLSSQGNQPMHSHCGRYVIAFNGEIYNYLCIRKELESFGVAPEWKGRSDTEIMLAAISYWGLLKAISKFVGMFAFALWDKEKKSLHLSRDRIGEKPLYYGWMGGVLLFGSELKALRKHPAWKGEVDPDTLALFMQYGYVPTPHSIYKNIFKVQPATIATFNQNNISSLVLPTVETYWQAAKLAQEGEANPVLYDEATAIDHLDRLLEVSVKQQMIADVPLGAFLSGGVDSSTIVAYMQKQSSRPVKTFTIGFREENYNEAVYAKEVARHLGTDHTELYVSAEQAMEVIPKIPIIYDEPFSDSSQIPTYLISQLTRKKVAVSLSGDGGDELFGGYNRYFWGSSIWGKIGKIPPQPRKLLAQIISSVPPSGWDDIYKILKSVTPEKLRQPDFGNKLHKLAKILGATNADSMFLGLTSLWDKSSNLVRNTTHGKTILGQSHSRSGIKNFAQRMMFLDAMNYLPDDILVKVDRASMAVGLETRVPFLNHHLIEFAWRTPLSMKIKNGQGKWLLRQVLYKYVPKELIERPKMGFAVPIGTWLRGPLRDWAEDLLDENRLKSEGFLNSTLVRDKWKEHLSGKKNWHHHIWTVLMFQGWLQNQE